MPKTTSCQPLRVKKKVNIKETIDMDDKDKGIGTYDSALMRPVGEAKKMMRYYSRQ